MRVSGRWVILRYTVQFRRTTVAFDDSRLTHSMATCACNSSAAALNPPYRRRAPFATLRCVAGAPSRLALYARTTT
jgi:hypothetical protein